MQVLKHLTLDQIAGAAQKLRCDTAMIMAVAEVEAPRGPFLDDGRPAILVERHLFHRFTGGKFSAGHPDISNSKAGGYKGGAAEWVRLAKARELDEEAALMATSWGMFQILGSNARSLGFDDVHDFVAMMHRSQVVEVEQEPANGGHDARLARLVTVPEQLAAFSRYLETNGLEGAMQRRDFAAVAKGYNGKNYRINRYDDKMAIAFVEARELLRRLGRK